MKKIRKLLSVLKVVFFGVFLSKKYEIKKGYNHRTKYTYLDTRDRVEDYQVEVYQKLKRVVKENDFKTVIDFGCGSAAKLIEHFDDHDTIGVDVSPTYEYLLEKYPNKKWANAENLDRETISGDIVVCADVIEHVLDPHEFLVSLNKIKDFKYLFISTPERDIVRSYWEYGPPANVHHIREWNGREFRAFISKYFDVVSQEITHYKQGTQLIVCKKKQ